jgi:hypothetical protein
MEAEAVSASYLIMIMALVASSEAKASMLALA